MMSHFFAVNNTKSRTNKRNNKKKKRSCSKETGSVTLTTRSLERYSILGRAFCCCVCVYDPHTLLVKIKIQNKNAADLHKDSPLADLWFPHRNKILIFSLALSLSFIAQSLISPFPMTKRNRAQTYINIFTTTNERLQGFPVFVFKM